MTSPKEKRLRQTLAGEAADHAPCSFWTHYPGDDLDAARIAAETVKFARALDLDFVKSMPNGLYCVEDWGVVANYDEIAKGGMAKVVKSAITEPGDWARIKRLDVRAGALGRELDHLARIVSALGRETPVIATVFSPLTIAKKLGEAAARAHMSSHPEAVLSALGEITATVEAFSRAAIELGCAGVFFAVQDATSKVGDAAYDRFGEPFDRAALEGAAAGWLNVIHMHGDDILFDRLSRYPVHALNWHVGETAPSIADYRAQGGRKPAVGGIRRMAITERDRAGVSADVRTALAGGGRGIIVTPGCVIRHPVDLALLADVVREVRASKVG